MCSSDLIPNLGGTAILVGFFLAILLGKSHSGITSVYLCSLLMFITGFLDDLKNISPKIRLGVQIATAGLTVWMNSLTIPSLYLTPAFSIALPEWFGFCLSVFIIIGAINSVNMVDGLDGLAGGLVLISTLLLSLLYVIKTNDYGLLLVFSIPMAGAILGFLKYNTYPASIFMGDSGSNWLGFMLGVLLKIGRAHV